MAEVVGGLLTGSLALLADAGHMLSDNLSLALALFAAWLAGRPATLEKNFGYKRAEILAALANGVTLVAISIWIFIESYHRFQHPPEILGGWVLAIATLGLLINGVGAAILSRSGSENLNVQGALRHVVADALGSVGIMVAALVTILTGWRYADPLVSVAIGVLILASSWGLLRDSTNILLEAPPPRHKRRGGRTHYGQRGGLGLRSTTSTSRPSHRVSRPSPPTSSSVSAKTATAAATSKTYSPASMASPTLPSRSTTSAIIKARCTARNSYHWVKNHATH